MLSPLTASELQWLAEWLGRRDDGAGKTTSELDGMSDGDVDASTDGDLLMIGANISLDDLASIINQTRVEDHWFGPVLESSLICAYTLVIAVGLVSNSLICFVVARSRSLRTPRNMLIVNLAASDIMMCLFCMPLTLIKLLLKNWPLGETLCRLTPWLQAANVFASTTTITAIALDRYHVILSSSATSSAGGGGGRRLAKAGCLIAGIWLPACLVGIPVAVYSGTTRQDYFVLVSFTMCLETWPDAGARFSYAVVVMLLQFALPLSVLAAVHWRISNFLKRRIQANPSTLSSMRTALRESKRHRKNTSLLMAITVMYALCWFPLTLLNFLADFNYSLFMYRNFLLVYAAAHLIAMTSAIANPILYGWYNSNFKRHFLRALRFWSFPDAGERAPPADERRVLNVVQAKRTSYKAIQTEEQPQLMTYTPHVSPVMMTEACQVSTGSDVSSPGNETPSP